MKNHEENQIDTTPFDAWNQRKKVIHEKNHFINAKEGWVWWCYLGINVGSEQNGKTDNFERPVVVIKRFSLKTVCVVPLTTQISKANPLVVSMESLPKQQDALISQIRVISTKRLVRRVGKISSSDFERILQAAGEMFIKTKPPLLCGGISEPEGHCEIIIYPEEQM